MNSPEDDSLEALRAHLANLRIGAISVYETTFYEEAVEEYARRAQIAYPGRYVERSGHKLVPPGMLFVGPAAVFGLRDGPRGAQGGIFTENMRRYHAPVRVGDSVRFEATISAKFLRRGRYYLEVSWIAFAASGLKAASGKELHTLGMVREPQS